MAELLFGTILENGQPIHLGVDDAKVLVAAQGGDPSLYTPTGRQYTADELAAQYEARHAIELEQQRLREFEANQAALVAYNNAVAAQQETTFLEDLAQGYVDFIEGDSTTAEFLTDPIGTTTGGTVGVVTDVLGTDVITGGITAAGGAVSDVLEPITEPLGEGIGQLVLPAAIIGGAYLLLK